MAVLELKKKKKFGKTKKPLITGKKRIAESLSKECLVGNWKTLMFLTDIKLKEEFHYLNKT